MQNLRAPSGHSGAHVFGHPHRAFGPDSRLLHRSGPVLGCLVLAILLLLGSAVLPPFRPALALETVLGAPISTGAGPIWAAANPTTNRIYVTNQGAGTVSVIDGRTNVKLGDINIGA